MPSALPALCDAVLPLRVKTMKRCVRWGLLAQSLRKLVCPAHLIRHVAHVHLNFMAMISSSYLIALVSWRCILFCLACVTDQVCVPVVAVQGNVGTH